MKTKSLIFLVIIGIFLISLIGVAYARGYKEEGILSGNIGKQNEEDNISKENENEVNVSDNNGEEENNTSKENENNSTDKYEENVSNINESNNGEDRGIGRELSKEIEQRREEYRQGNFTGPMGRFLNVRELSEDLRELRVGDVSADTKLNISEERERNETKLKVHLGNGKNAEIKIMPDTASKRALERLSLKVCTKENNCTIELKEVGQGIVYEVDAEKNAKILGIFKTKMKVQADVDADTGDVTRVSRPWWSFLASESEE